jgi:Cu-Zn family superoxide dismutase
MPVQDLSLASVRGAFLLTPIVVALSVAGCDDTTSSPSPLSSARATMEARSGSQATGTATFTERGGTAAVVVEVSGASPGTHGLHVHETGDCSASDATSAGPHFNPDNAPHDGLGPGPRHAGDLGNIAVAADGRGRAEVAAASLSVQPGPHSVVGRAVVLHEAPDDLVSQPAGNSGARIACGIIR